jgi:predicted RNA-binding protein with PIN domain
MQILIDGYNLLHVTGIFGTPGHPRAFQQARERLLAHLADRLGASRAAHTTVVFDASEAPPGLPRQTVLSGISVHFAADHNSADDLLELFIESHTAPKQLTVVSSDHRVQRAARRRKATYLDSDVWYRELLRSTHETDAGSATHDSGKPSQPLDEHQVREWVELFNAGSENKTAQAPETPHGTRVPRAPHRRDTIRRRAPRRP